jgi:PhoPQ-activated pathogenicity-related protein
MPTLRFHARSRLHSPCAALLLSVTLACAAGAAPGALEKYVAAPDATFKWSVLEARTLDNGSTVAHVEMTSQSWRGHVWTHHMQIVRAKDIRNPHIALVFVTGDGDGKRNIAMLQLWAERAGAIAACVTRVPNQPLYDGRKEDALIAFTFDNYLKDGDDTWPLLFPMAKSAVRAMDTVAAWAKQEHKQTVDSFVVSGASKRGWTTWLTAAVDARVKAIAPMVIDMLNMKVQTDWTKKCYGRQSEQIRDYTDLGLIDRLDDERMRQIRGWVDPYSYRARYTMPKLILLGTNDRYWTVDALRHYFHDLPGPKLIYQTPNAGHNLNGGADAAQSLAAFYQHIADKQPLPTLDWKFAGDGKVTVTVKCSQNAKAIRLWTATSADRDFRDDQWSSRDLEVKPGSANASVEVSAPEMGFRAYLAEVELVSPTGHTWKLSTEARVTPDFKP